MTTTVIATAYAIDALNVAHWCGRQSDLRLPLRLYAALRAQAAEVWLVFDASAPHRFAADAADAAVYAALRCYPGVLEVPAGRRADGELLRIARRSGGCIVSRDRFRDYRSRYRRLIDAGDRVLGGHVADGRLQLPALGLSLDLPASSAAALAACGLAERPG